jgi:ubiquinone/menaquinone biosynthesis C-methylase UbiE
MENLILKVDSEYYLSQKNDAGEDEGGWKQQMLRAIESATEFLSKNAKIIDIGCYRGHGLTRLKELGFTNLVGVDLVFENIERVNALGEGISGICADMHDLSMFTNQEFDFAFMSHSIEHAIDPVKVINEVFRIAKNGLIIFPIEFLAKRCNPPHYYTFNNVNDVVEVLGSHIEKCRLTGKKRLGHEIWCQF